MDIIFSTKKTTKEKRTTIIWIYIIININVQIACLLVSFIVWKLIWRKSCKPQNTLSSVENGILLEQFMVFLWESNTNQKWNPGIPYFPTIPEYPPLIHIFTTKSFKYLVVWEYCSEIDIRLWLLLCVSYWKWYLNGLQ